MTNQLRCAHACDVKQSGITVSNKEKGRDLLPDPRDETLEDV